MVSKGTLIGLLLLLLYLFGRLRHILRQPLGTDNRKVANDISNSYQYGEGEKKTLLETDKSQRTKLVDIGGTNFLQHHIAKNKAKDLRSVYFHLGKPLSMPW
jgi:hypothetical protein